MPKTAPLVGRFWSKVVKGPTDNACWGWCAGVSHDGYGWLNRGCGEGMAHAHRISWELHFGQVPDGLYVLHSCDNPPCTNPAHLFLGTQLDNMADMMGKGRGGPRGGAFGEENGIAKLTDDQIREIRHLYALGDISQVKLAKKFNVTQTPISLIIRRVTWRHIL